MGAESGDNSRETMIADDSGSNGRYNGPKNFSYEENDERFRRPRGQTYNTASRIPVKSTGQGAKYGSGPYNQYNSREGNFQHERGGPYSHRPFDKDSFYRREMQEGKTNHLTGRFFREAKMPAKQTWMPHSRNIRHINTSTK
ncbi:uncharacterized protein LOC123529640 [Mercenaria mercenaria]|uniref:uncharacterized protein LOC123529640 n=1 Tax=Mercenaria mercenaria TaxID=6596 RepID=UPI00234EADA6|nr:uncharacterized protein LOC123529640 [Mercenaria mercenaria]